VRSEATKQSGWIVYGELRAPRDTIVYIIRAIGMSWPVTGQINALGVFRGLGLDALLKARKKTIADSADEADAPGSCGFKSSWSVWIG